MTVDSGFLYTSKMFLMIFININDTENIPWSSLMQAFPEVFLSILCHSSKKKKKKK